MGGEILIVLMPGFYPHPDPCKGEEMMLLCFEPAYYGRSKGLTLVSSPA